MNIYKPAFQPAALLPVIQMNSELEITFNS
jgi:hypothetical protein